MYSTDPNEDGSCQRSYLRHHVLHVTRAELLIQRSFYPNDTISYRFLFLIYLEQIQTEMGAANAARHAAGRIFRLADDELLIDPLGDGGARGPSKGCALDFSAVKFAYPQRPDAQVY